MSHSRINAFKTCPEKHALRYIDRVKPIEQGASLAFGSAVDTALTALLRAKKKGSDARIPDNFNFVKYVFEEDEKYGWKHSFDVDKNRYTSSDYNASVFTEADLKTIAKWESELGITQKDAVSGQKQRKYKPFKGNTLKLYNRLAWLSLLRKGHLMLEAFLRDIYPNIREVIAVQHRIDGDVEGVASVIGYIDLICMYGEYEKPLILDIKTASSPYDESNCIDLSEQLHLYTGAVGEELGSTLTGFIVLLKNPSRGETVCSKCGHIKDSRHKTCNNEVDGERCAGEWKDGPLIGDTQFILKELDWDTIKSFLQDFNNCVKVASTGIRYKVRDRCLDYGMCDYYHLCHYGDTSKYTLPKNSRWSKEAKKEKSNE